MLLKWQTNENSSIELLILDKCDGKFNITKTWFMITEILCFVFIMFFMLLEFPCTLCYVAYNFTYIINAIKRDLLEIIKKYNY